MPDWDKDDDFGTINQLDYQYFDGSNRLRSVTDGILKNDTSGKGEFVDGNKDGDDYVYDPNGNMTQDLNKGIKGATLAEKGIEYNHLNLPTLVGVHNGADVGTISYIYDATGVKLRKNVLKKGETTPTGTDYAGNYIYDNGKLQFFSQPEGYVEPKNPDNLSQGFDYIYQYKDHLGNIRLSYKNVGTASNVDLEIQEENNYYPFGLEHKGYNFNISGVENNYQTYNGKELDESLGLNWIDYGARNYDASLGRRMNTDLLEQFHSPYVYAGNDPIRYMDPTGLYSTEEWKKDNGITDDDVTEVYNSNNSAEDCPKCNDQYVLINAVQQSALEHGVNVANEYIDNWTRKDKTAKNKYDYQRADVFKLSESMDIGADFTNLEEDEYYKFTMTDLVISIDGSKENISSDFSYIIGRRGSSASGYNISEVELGVHSKNQTGGSRSEGKIRFRGSNGKIIANLNFRTEEQYNAFWRTNFTNLKNTMIMSTISAYDKKNGTDISSKIKDSSWTIIE